MGKRIVIALGGNALGKNLEEQKVLVQVTAKAIVDLIAEGHEVIVAHGNGPQVGLIKNSMDKSVPMPVCVAMSQGYIGFDLQNALREQMHSRGINKGVATVLTQVEVDPQDPAFQHPTKPIGNFMTKEEAEALEAKGLTCMEDAGRGYRQVVASPLPKSIVEIDSIRTLVESGNVVIACGGGGIPVIKTGEYSMEGVAAVIDKDFASNTMAQMLDADCLIILTAVEKVGLNYGKPNAKWLDEMTPAEAEKYIHDGEFAPGSMLPKIQAAVNFVKSKDGRTALITLLEKAKDGVAGKTGTHIHQ